MEEQPRRERLSPVEVFNKAFCAYARDLTTPDPLAEKFPINDTDILTKNQYGLDLKESKDGMYSVYHCDQNIGSSGIAFVTVRTDVDVDFEGSSIEIAFTKSDPSNIIQIQTEGGYQYVERRYLDYDLDSDSNRGGVSYGDSKDDRRYSDEDPSEEQERLKRISEENPDKIIKIEGENAEERYRQIMDDPKSWHETVMYCLNVFHALNPQTPAFTEYLQKTYKELSQSSEDMD